VGRFLILTVALVVVAGCSRKATSTASQPSARNLLLITIDTLRADRIGAYGYGRAKTPVMDGLAARGARFAHAYATAPITLTSHASLMTGRYPPGHGARHNGMRLDQATPTLAETLGRAGFSTGAFVGAFPLDRRFGLIKGFATYGDRMPRGAQGRAANERAGRIVVDEALAWLGEQRGRRFFLWVHLFEPHAPYGTPGDSRPLEVRYDEEVAETDRQTGRLIEALGAEAGSTIVVIAADHGEAFGEHGEIGHSIFVYDTTLQVPLIVTGPGVAPRVIEDPVALLDLPPTVTRLLGLEAFDADGVDLSPALAGAPVPERELYAESFAPLLDFGWSPFRTLRADGYKYIASPKPELFVVARDRAESVNLVQQAPARAAQLRNRLERISPAALATTASIDPETAGRLQALGYVSGSAAPQSSSRPDPKDRRELAARLARVTSGEVSGPALETTLREILKDDPGNPQAHMRLGYALIESGRCTEAGPHFRAAIAARLPTADAHLGLASCYAVARDFDRALTTLRDAAVLEPNNPVVVANQGVLLSDRGRPQDAIPLLQRALTLDPGFHQARFNLALAFARTGRRTDAAAEADELLRRMPPDAPQRREIERLRAAVR
jgi:arylsulfatase A-like enzyme/Tfp pilus assembly protein PilF